ncbi:MAG TPA: hypothetical protein VHC69_22070 [Polyangiaceae bacterium]|nr:hypothetical protein [Polyangiaceae bacterium]
MAETTRHPLFRLGRGAGRTLAYVFDLGNELRHRIDVLDVRDVPQPLAVPTLVEAIGDAPTQYERTPDDLDDADLDDDETFVRDPELEAKVRTLQPVARRLDAATSTANAADWDLSAAVTAALELASGLAGNRELLDELDDVDACGLIDKLLGLPFALARAGRIEDAEAIARASIDSTGASCADCSNHALFQNARFSITRPSALGHA